MTDIFNAKVRGDVNKDYWWIAINGASCAASLIPFKPLQQMCIPTPEQMIGFATQEEQLEAQDFCLNAPLEEVKKRMEEYSKRTDIAVVCPASPEPPTTGSTMWASTIPQRSVQDGNHRVED